MHQIQEILQLQQRGHEPPSQSHKHVIHALSDELRIFKSEGLASAGKSNALALVTLASGFKEIRYILSHQLRLIPRSRKVALRAHLSALLSSKR